MIEPHTIENGQIQKVEAWVICPKCNNARHRVLPGEKAPWWFCQDEKQILREDQEIEVEYVDDD